MLSDILKDRTDIAFSPTHIGSIRLRNRIGLAPMNTGMIDNQGLPTEDFEKFHTSYAEKGVGLIFIGGVGVSSGARASQRSLSLDSPQKADSLKKTVDKLIGTGALPVIQLMHSGRQSSLPGPLVAASALPGFVSSQVPLALRIGEIKGIVEDFGRAARLAQRAGFQVIELHAAHGYLLSDFLSPSLNRRSDDYGGTIDNRFRMLQEIIACVRQISGLSIGVRLNGKENIPDGLNIVDLSDLVKRCEEAGACYVSISAGVYNVPDLIMPDRRYGEVIYRQLGQKAKDAASIPVMLAGNITSIESVNEVLRNRAADITLMGRALLANPNILEEYLEGRTLLSSCCTMRQVCKYNSRRLPQISCPHNHLLMEQLTVRLKSEGRSS